MNLYEILNVPETASKDEIKTAYRRLAAKHHPDRGGDTATFQSVQNAYDTLMDDNKRAEYDAMKNGQMHGGGFNVNIDDIFKSFGFSFGDANGFSPFMRHQRKNPDIQGTMSIDLKETLSDQTKFVNINTKSGETKTLEIKIPRGIRSGTVMKFSGGGESIFPQMPPGDLYLKVLVAENENFLQRGLDLECTLNIDCFDAILGCDTEVRTLSDKIFSIRVPANTQQFTRLKIPGEGLYEFQKDIRGNFYVKINITIPTNLSTEQLELIRKIKTSL